MAHVHAVLLTQLIRMTYIWRWREMNGVCPRCSTNTVDSIDLHLAVSPRRTDLLGSPNYAIIEMMTSEAQTP